MSDLKELTQALWAGEESISMAFDGSMGGVRQGLATLGAVATGVPAWVSSHEKLRYQLDRLYAQQAAERPLIFMDMGSKEYAVYGTHGHFSFTVEPAVTFCAPATGEPIKVDYEDDELTSGQAIPPAPHPTSPNTPKGLTRTAHDGERLGRLGWMPGAK